MSIDKILNAGRPATRQQQLGKVLECTAKLGLQSILTGELKARFDVPDVMCLTEDELDIFLKSMTRIIRSAIQGELQTRNSLH